MRGLLRWAFGFAVLVACGRAVVPERVDDLTVPPMPASAAEPASAVPPADASAPAPVGRAPRAPVAKVSPPDGGPIIDPDTPVSTNGGRCAPWSQVASQPFVASPSDPLSQPAATLLARTATKMAGSWIGRAVVPIGGRQTGVVRFEFARDSLYQGHYSSASSGGGTAFGYGAVIPACAPFRQWRLDGVLASGIFGEIDVPYGATYPDGGTWCGPGGQGNFERMEMSASATRVRFVFSTSSASGAQRSGLLYDLWRTCASR